MSRRSRFHIACLATGLQAIYIPADAIAATNLIAVPTTTGVFCGQPISHFGNIVYHVDEPGRRAKGSSGNDVIIGTPSGDTIHGLAGDDCIFGMDGDDHIQGDGGNDVIYGGRGDDRLLGNPNADSLLGDAGKDVLDGGNGSADECYADAEDDTSTRCELVEIPQFPTLVAVGDIACNPFESPSVVKDYFNGGYALASKTCRQGFISAIALALDPDAVASRVSPTGTQEGKRRFSLCDLPA